MKWLFVLVALISIALAGAACAADQPGSDNDKPAATLAAGQSNTGDDDQAATTSQDQSNTEDNDQAATTGEDEPEKARAKWGLVVGLYNPVNSRVKDIFGDSWLRIGLHPLPTDLPEHWRIAFDGSYYSMSRGNDKVKLIPITVGVLRGFGQDEKMRSYVALRAGPYYGDLNAPSIGVDKTGFGLNANATYGMIWKERFVLEGRYEFMDKFGGLDFSAFSISAAIRILN